MSIGAYAVEKDYSHYVSHAAKTILAVVGTATKGPVGVATVCTSAQDLVNKFGPLHPSCYALYAGQYFLSQSNKLYFVRAASDSAAAATTNISGANSSDVTVADAVTLSMKEKGTYYDGYSVVVTAGTESGTYNISLKSPAGTVIESISGISLDTLADSESGVYSYKTAHMEVTAANATAATIAAGTYTFSGGNNGISDVDSGDYILAANSLASDIVDMNLFAVPGVSEPAVVTAMLTLAETRGDCLYLVDPPQGLTKEGVVQWSQGSGEYDHSALNSSYGAIYYDWVNIYDSVNKTRVQVPPSVPVCASIAYSDRISELWYAPAGLNRGIIRGVLDSTTKLNKVEVDELYRASINSIYDDPQVGLVLWGQKTLYKEDSALNRINVRRLMSYLKRVISAACNYLTFEPNDRNTWNSFEMKIIPILNSLVDRRGLYDYQINKGETIVSPEDIDNYRMPCRILVRPTKAAEEIPIYFVITSTGVDFNSVLESNGVVLE